MSRLEYCAIYAASGDPSHPGCVYNNDTGVAIVNSSLWLSWWGVGYGGTGHLTEFSGNYPEVVGVAVSTHPEYVRMLGADNEYLWGAIAVDPGAVVTGGTWKDQGVPYVLLGTVTIGDATHEPVITIEPGTAVAVSVGSEAALVVGPPGQPGGLNATGTEGAPVEFRAYELEYPNPPAVAGDWLGVRFLSSTLSPSRLERCVIEDGGGSPE